MEKTLQPNLRAKRDTQNMPEIAGIGWGVLGGLAGTLLMDGILMGALSVLGLPALTCFSIVGNTVGRFFSIIHIENSGGIPLGVATHYLVGPAIGAIFGILVTRIRYLRSCSTKKIVFLAILYVEILSQPILALTPILLEMRVPETIQWFGFSFVMHLVYGLILGVMLCHGIRLATYQANANSK